jgi:L-ascorbate metabolism protein UlaG (beta-lactamase superfamily)
VEIPSVGVFNTVEPQPESGITVNFPGIKAATVQYYTNVAGWQTVGVFDDACNFAIPEEHKATWGATTVQVAKGGMYHTFTLNSLDNNIVLDVPIKTITVVGIAAECSLAIVQNDWVYPYADASVGVANEFLVFGNGKTYEARLSRPGFYPINLPGIDAGKTVNFGSSYIYEVEVPAGVTNVWISSYDWAVRGANAGEKITLFCDVTGTIRDAKMRYDYNGANHSVDFKLDGKDPFAGLVPRATLLYQGHGSLRITTLEGKVIYIDPYAGAGYNAPADLILITHPHSDHTAVHLIEKQNTDCQTITHQEALVDGVYKTFSLGFVTVEAVQAGNNPNHNINVCVGYILTFSDGKTVYVSGDTSKTAQMATFAQRNLDYAFFCCDGVYNMDIPEAIECALLVEAKYSIPYHMVSGQNFNRERAELFKVENRLIIADGETITL